jgi:hypothetical protein
LTREVSVCVWGGCTVTACIQGGMGNGAPALPSHLPQRQQPQMQPAPQRQQPQIVTGWETKWLKHTSGEELTQPQRGADLHKRHE